MSSPPESLQQFPCDYTFKIFGRQSPTVVDRVTAIVARTFGPLPDDAVSVRASSGGRYVSITIVLRVDERAQLEVVYGDLRNEAEVLLYI